MMAGGAWSDLLPRLGTAIILACVAAGALITGGMVFAAFLLIAVALMHWELGQMLNPMSRQSGRFAAAFAAGTFLFAMMTDSLSWSMIFIFLGAFCQLLCFHKLKRSGFAFSLAIFLTGFTLVSLRESFGLSGVLWLLAVVILTDIGGYFGGRLIGGPKLIARFSPKKTWSGAATGWGFSVLLTVYLAETVLPEVSLTIAIVFTIILSMTSQVGDICESALKRACGVKDSSQLLPGHGGLMDRFDGTVGATLAFAALSPFLGAL